MGRIVTYLISLICFGTALFSCTEEREAIQVDGSSEYVTINLNSKALISRATEVGTESLNENIIRTADIFLYPDGKTDENTVFHQNISLASNNGTANVNMKVPVARLETLFGADLSNGATCRVYVIANIGTSSWSDATSIPALKKTVIEADFTKDQQEAFVMDGEGTLILAVNGTEKTVSGSIDLVRAASKISLLVTEIKDKVLDENGDEWFSVPEQMEVIFNNGVKKTHVDVSCSGCGYTVQTDDYFSFSNANARKLSKREETDGGVTNTYYSHTPFYSYSSNWNGGIEKAAYLTLIVPWQKSGEAEYKPCYYQVPINELTKSFERNNYYKVKLKVGVLGSFVPDIPVYLECSYVIEDWSNEQINTSLKDYRYLIVDKNDVVMDNIDSIDISYLSSHDVELANVTMSRPVLKNGKDDEYEVYNAMNYLTLGKDKITFSHTLNNDRTDIENYDYVPYTVEFDIWHKDNHAFIEHIKITQRPALYVVASKNGGSNGKDMVKYGDKWYDGGYVYVNGARDQYGNVTGLGSATNRNPYMYVISTSALGAGSAYVIGDPRSRDIDLIKDDNGNWSKYASALEGGERLLRNYYPTDYSSRTENMVAPKFRIASSYGVASAQDYDNMRRRCASYQEYGYPAGRWRMPTKAEVEYIVRLSAEGKIPKLFNDNNDSTKGNYWCAHGIAYPQRNGTVDLKERDGSSHSVRCVYDEWYWTDKLLSSEYSTFTWGDKKIEW